MSEESVMKQAEVEEAAGLELPPKFRFRPTDEEIISHYLTPKALDDRFVSGVIGEDFNKCEPWDLPGKAKIGEELYFFCHKDRKYPTGTRTNRATENGYWKATGKDKGIFRGRGLLVGMKKMLVFYRGRAPRGEDRLGHARVPPRGQAAAPAPPLRQDEWAVCKVFNKELAARTGPMAAAGAELERVGSLGFISEFLDSAETPPLMDPSFGAGVDEVIDFKGPGSTSAHAAPEGMMNYLPVKMEEHHAPTQYQQQAQTCYSSPYFSLPAVNFGNLSPSSIRRHCKAEQGELPLCIRKARPRNGMPREGPPSGSGGDLPPWTKMVAGLFVLAVVVSLLCLFWRRGQRVEGGALDDHLTEFTRTDAQKGKASGYNNLPLWVKIFVGVFILAVISVALLCCVLSCLQNRRRQAEDWPGGGVRHVGQGALEDQSPESPEFVTAPVTPEGTPPYSTPEADTSGVVRFEVSNDDDIVELDGFGS
ncbi:hypothetical protein ACP70R_017266 [Stipagrostis hirtigluma subsp. patula]